MASSGANKENDISNISKPFSFQNYFSNLSSPSSTDKIKFNNSRARTNFIMGSAYKVCPRPTRKGKMLSQVTSSKNSTCFICGQEFPLSELTSHEKTCLENIQSNDIQYTRQNTDDSSNYSFPSTYASNISNHSSSSGEGTEKKYSRCYICGSDVPNYLSSIHEKNCKKSWETGLLNSICTPARKTKSKGDVRSLSRNGSRGDLNSADSLTKPNLYKSKSSTNLRTPSPSVGGESKSNDGKPRHLKSTNSRTSSNNNAIKSKSTTNLSKKSSSTSNSNNDLYTTKSSEDLRKTSDKPEKSDKSKKHDNNPQYVICQTCGKLYSVHSISIHQRQCERTYKKQKDLGTNVEYKIKSKSLADLTGSKSTNRRPQTAMTSRLTTPKSAPRPASANPINRTAKGTSLSASTGNLAPTYKRQLLKVTKETVNGETKLSVSNQDVSKSPGLQKCYLCGQLYGTRSLPIHEKQCLKKWERSQEEEKKKKNVPLQKEIQIMSFGRNKSIEEDTENFSDDVELAAPRDPVISPSKLFGIPSPLKKPTTNTLTRTLGNEINSELSIDDKSSIDVTDSVANDSVTKYVDSNNGDSLTSRPSSAKKTNSKFVVCVYCYKQYGLHSIAIHEKNCRERKTIETKSKDRVANGKSATMTNKKLSKSVGDITAIHAYSNGDGLGLVKCDECLRKFLSTDIEQHRAHCRVSVL